MQPVLFDSSIYITALRTGDEAALSLRRLAVDSPIWLSAVVLEELYAGIAPRGRHVLERFERDFEKARRILVPNLNDWTETGKVLARLANKYDYEKIGQGRRFGLCVGSRHAQQRHVRADDLFGTLIRTQRVG